MTMARRTTAARLAALALLGGAAGGAHAARARPDDCNLEMLGHLLIYRLPRRTPHERRLLSSVGIAGAKPLPDSVCTPPCPGKN